MDKVKGIFPAQCSCGHLFLERYQFDEPNKDGEIGFCWCGFCRTKLMVRPYQEQPVYVNEKDSPNASEEVTDA